MVISESGKEISTMIYAITFVLHTCSVIIIYFLKMDWMWNDAYSKAHWAKAINMHCDICNKAAHHALVMSFPSYFQPLTAILPHLLSCHIGSVHLFLGSPESEKLQHNTSSVSSSAHLLQRKGQVIAVFLCAQYVQEYSKNNNDEVEIWDPTSNCKKTHANGMIIFSGHMTYESVQEMFNKEVFLFKFSLSTTFLR